MKSPMQRFEKRSPQKALSSISQKLKAMKTPLSTSLGAVNFVLLGGMGELAEEQKQFLTVAKKNMEALFMEIQKFIDSMEGTYR